MHTLHQVNDSPIYYTSDIFVTTLLQACHDCSIYNILCVYYCLIQRIKTALNKMNENITFTLRHV